MPGYHLPWFTAAATGIYERHGLDVEIVDPYPGPANARAAAMGRYDVCLTSVAHYFRAQAEEPALPARFVFMVARRTHMAAFAVVGRRARHGREIESFADLEGASVLGSPDKTFSREYDALLRHLGLERGPLVEKPYDETIAALAAGEADVAADFLDLRPAFEAHGVRVRPLPFFEAGIDVYGSGLVAGDAFAEARGDDLRRLVAVAREALEATREDVEPGLAALRARIPDLDETRARAGWEAGQPLVFGDGELGEQDAEKWRRTIAYHHEVHGTPLLDEAAVFDDSFLAAPVSGR